MDATVARVGPRRVNPSVYFRPTAQPISNSPATNRTTHTMFAPPWMTRSSPSDAGTREVVLTMLHESYVGRPRGRASGTRLSRLRCGRGRQPRSGHAQIGRAHV